MPCSHKFSKYLTLDKLDFEPTTLIVGTFSPEGIDANEALWLFGRTDEVFFWDILPRLYNEPSLQQASAADWKQFCKRHRIAITDLISTIEDADAANKQHAKILSGFSDKAIAYHFDDFAFVDIVAILQRNPTIRHVYLTRAVTEAFWRYAWNPIAYHCNQNQLHERKLLTPTTDATYHHTAHNAQNPDAAITRLEDYVLMRWRQDWHTIAPIAP
jgi:hypothetical protein